MRPSLFAAALLAGAFAIPTSTSAATILYDQPFDGFPGNGYLSEDTGVVPAAWRLFDNFTLTADGLITRVRFVGAYVNFAPGGGAPPPDSTAFAFRFFADVASAPASVPLHEESVAFAVISSTLLGTGTTSGYPSTFYTFTADLPVGFAASGSVPYWLSISSVAPADDVGWAWFSRGPDAVNAGSLHIFDGTTLITRGRDRAFTLEGVSVPEPATLLLVGSALAGLVSRARRSRRAR